MGGSDHSDAGNAGSTASTKPYLIRAVYEWAMDNGFTPQILVNTEHEQVVVPVQYVKEDRIVLNIHPKSVNYLEMGNDFLMCSARFSGRAFELTVPVFSVMAIYAKENGQGIVFQDENDPVSPPATESGDSGEIESAGAEKRKPNGRKGDSPSHLKLVR